ncbi:NTP transferase domain-containing protein [Sedimentitalea sp. HM32M-2]|uniref:nucleotidyltransferase family protein n=1 Tax=Sedimentitalea sp. HM32M-2 TaxID=3351566 RepID=UPI00362B6AC8
MSKPDADIPIIVLAAGASRRMRGIDKLMLPVDGRPLLRRQVDLARAVTSGPVIVTLPPPPHARYGALAGSGATAVPVADAEEGMNAALRAGFAALPGSSRAAMLLLADLPDLSEDDLRNVLHSVDLNSDFLVWRGATQDGEPGHPVVFAAPLFARIARLSGDSGGREVVAAAGNRVALIRLPGRHARRDLDTPEDWARWRAAHQNAR